MGDAAMKTVLPTIYRQLLKMGRSLDRHPMSKALLVAQPARLFDRRARAVVDLPSLSGWSHVLHEYNRGEFYAPQASAVEAVKRARTSPLSGDPIDHGLTALRALSLAVEGGESLGQEHSFDCGAHVEREVTRVRAPESRSGAGEAAYAVKPGSLLLTHPVSCLKQPSLHHAVILIVEATDDVVSGVVINKPLGVSLGGACADEEVREQIGRDLESAPLFKGGDVCVERLLMVHDFEGLEDSTHIAGGLYATTSFDEVRQALERSGPLQDGTLADARHSPARVKCCAGYAGWAPEQLAAELERNVWFLCEADDVARLALLQPPPPALPAQPAETQPEAQPEAQPETRPETQSAAMAAGSEAASSWQGMQGMQQATYHDEAARHVEGAHGWLRDVMWSGVLAQLGEEHAELARFPGDHELVWRHMEALWEAQTSELHRRIDAIGEPESDRS